MARVSRIVISLSIRNLLRNGRRSLLIGLLIVACVVIALVGNSFFESSSAGLKRTFIDCFTGDLFISPRTERPLSLFGEDTPIIGSYVPIAALPRQDEILQIVKPEPAVASVTAQVSGYALMEAEGSRNPVVLFGVDGGDYFQAFSSVRLVKGSFLRTANPGIMIADRKVREIGKATSHELSLGDPVQLTVFTSHGFSIREVPLSGTFEFPTSNTAMDRIAYVDANTLRALNGMIQGGAEALKLPAETQRYLDEDLGSIFNSEAGVAKGDSGIRLTDVEGLLGRSKAQQGAVAPDRASWNFLLIRLKPGTDAQAVKRDLEDRLRSHGLEARVGDWRAAAGSGSALAGSLSFAFNVGLGILALVIVLILANSFATMVAERTSEIATMRAMGARKGFVRALFFGEATILSAIAGAAGAIVGALLIAYMHRRGFSTGNRILAMVFGGNMLRPLLTPRTILGSLLGAVVTGGVASLFAVRLALRITPARAMESE